MQQQQQQPQPQPHVAVADCDKQRICLSAVKLLTVGAKQQQETAANAVIFQLARESNKMRTI